jgi:hypothetical protein
MENVEKDTQMTKKHFIPQHCFLEDESSKFILFNFRGKVSFVGKDLVSEVPYLKALTGVMSNSPRDEDGYLMIDENSSIFYCVLDKYREWLELGQPDAFEHSVPSRGLCVSLAR